MSYPTCDFKIEKVREYYKKYLPRKEWVKYLQFILEEYKGTDKFGTDKSGFGQKVYADILILSSDSEGTGSGRMGYEGFEKIQWNGSLIQLVYLFNRLTEEKLIDKITFKGKKWSMVSKMFLDKSGREIGHGILQESEKFLENNAQPNNTTLVDKIIDETKEIR